MNLKNLVTQIRNSCRIYITPERGKEKNKTMTSKTLTNSSLISEATFENGRLTLRFKNGRTTAYNGVPASKFDRLVNSDSPGRVYNQEIRSQYSHA